METKQRILIRVMSGYAVSSEVGFAIPYPHWLPTNQVRVYLRFQSCGSLLVEHLVGSCVWKFLHTNRECSGYKRRRERRSATDCRPPATLVRWA